MNIIKNQYHGIVLFQSDFNKIAGFISITEIANIALISHDGMRYATKALKERAVKYGFERSSLGFINFLKTFFKNLREIFKLQPLIKLANKEKNLELLFQQFKELNSEQLFTLFSNEEIYSLPLDKPPFSMRDNKWTKSEVLSNSIREKGETALCVAAKHCSFIVMRQLLKLGANPNAGRPNENRPLHFSVKEGDEKAVKLLLKNGANINEKGFMGYTPLTIAWSTEDCNIISLLSMRGAKPPTKEENKYKFFPPVPSMDIQLIPKVVVTCENNQEVVFKK